MMPKQCLNEHCEDKKRFLDQTILILSTTKTLAVLFKEQGKLDEAQTMFERALIALIEQEKALGPDHPDTLATAHNIGAVSMDQGQLDDAKAMFEVH